MIKKVLGCSGALFLLFLAACGGNTQSIGAGTGGAQAHAGSGSAAGGSTVKVERCPGCEPDEDCCLATGHCYSPSRAPEECEPPPPLEGGGSSGGGGGAGVPLTPEARRCSSNAHCSADEICRPDSDASACVSVGYCVARSCKLTCLNGADCEKPVCGCDGQTYATEDDACQAGVRTATTAACGEPVPSLEGGAPVIGCGSGDDCPDQYSCCEISGRCYPSDCPGCCAPTPPGTNAPCERNEHCPTGQYCSGGGCDAAGGCRFPKSAGDCGGEAAEVCGCDGKTYTNECWAAAAGSRVAATGRCR